jgi:mRNA interferase MazF
MPTTTNYNRGTVVLLPFPFSDQSAAKLRPAVVASPSYPSEDLIVVALSSFAGDLRPGEYRLQYWREAGLLHPSFVKRAIASVSNDLVRKSIGSLHPSDLAQLDIALRQWLAL